MRNTSYAREIATATDSIGQSIERIHVKDHDREEIRFSWWKDGNIVIRPLDLPESELLPLMRMAMEKGVFSDEFIQNLGHAVVDHLAAKAARQR
ncbi:MAG: hypothetical protein KAG62_10375 [Caulobacter sp.]|nr:hypothetical protein [Caulobacter sp.]